jgi:glycosyltransferase involved in cell wall biosynthesis
VEQIIDRYDIEVVVGTFVVPPPRAARVIFDLFDENTAGWELRAPRYAQEIASNERDYLMQADAVVAASSVLVEKARDLGARAPVVHIPNGLDIQQFQHGRGIDFKAEHGVVGEIVGVVGNHDNSVEIMKILDIAAIYPDRSVTFVIAGRGAAIPAARQAARRRGLQNLIFTGEFKTEATAGIVATFDVGLCPYDVTPMDHARTPLRLLAYAAAGIPTVCTDLKEVRRMNLSNTIMVEDTAADFVRGIQLAFKSPREAPEQIRSYDLSELVPKYEKILLGEFDFRV